MKREDKKVVIDNLAEKFNSGDNFYISNISGLSANESNELRKLCFENGIVLQFAKNTLIKKALEKANITEQPLFDALKEASSVMFSESINAGAKLIKEYRKKSNNPVLKAAYIEGTTFVGDQSLTELAALKDRKELIADVIMLLKSPMNNVVAALQSGGQTISGILKTLFEKEG